MNIFSAGISPRSLNFIRHYDKNNSGGLMNNETGIDLHQLHAVGIPVGDLPEDPPRRDGCALFALITKDNSMEFTVAIGDVCMYDSYRTKTHHPGDCGSWLFRKMELFFVPECSIASG
jgi:hypothetical protein